MDRYDGRPMRGNPESGFSIFTLFLMVAAFTALAIAIAALAIANKTATSSQHTNFPYTVVNVTLSGVCGDFPVSVVFSKVGRLANVEVPAFSCNGTTNSSGEGLRFTLPSGYDADMLLARGPNGTTDLPYPAEYVLFCAEVEEPLISSAYSCTTKNNSLAYIQGNMLVMGTGVPEDAFIAGTVNYGPSYGFTISYYTTNSTLMTVTSGAAKPPVLVNGLLAGIVALGLIVL